MLCGNRIVAVIEVADVEIQTVEKRGHTQDKRVWEPKKTDFLADFSKSPVGRQKKRFRFHTKSEPSRPYCTGDQISVKLFARKFGTNTKFS